MIPILPGVQFKVQLISLCILLIGLMSCGEDAVDEIPVIEVPTDTVATVSPIGTEHYLDGDSEYIFDQNMLRTYELQLPAANLAELDEDPAAEEYVAGTLIFEGDTISPVGIRYKGSIGAFVGCLSGANVFEPSGFKTCTKLSMKIKINWEGREEQFFKLKKLQFHSMNNDPSQMRERLGYWLFTQMGVKTPRAVHARLIINGEYAGLFALVEQIDGRFVKHNFDDDDGNLYKEIWPLTMNGEPYIEQEYRAALKTNEDENASVDLIRNFGQRLATADDATARQTVEEYMDIDATIAHAVVDRVIKHDDGPFHWYCDNGYCTNHNYYWYEEPNQQKLHLIPWDLDNAFENIISAQNVVTTIADNWGETSNDCAPFRFGPWGIWQWSASCDKLTKVWTTYDQLFEEKKNQLITGPLSLRTTEEMLDKWRTQIYEATKTASETHNDAVSLGEWDAAISNLKEQLDFAREN